MAELDPGAWSVEVRVPSPFALPLLVKRFRERLTTGKLSVRLARMLADMERAAAEPEPVVARRRRVKTPA